MAHLSSDDGRSIEIADGSPLQDPCEQLDVVFGCSSGLCHSCRIEIVQGAEHLTDLTDQEKQGGLDRTPDRLACQCSIKQGSVVFRY